MVIKNKVLSGMCFSFVNLCARVKHDNSWAELHLIAGLKTDVI